MKIGEAQKEYAAYMNQLWNQRRAYMHQQDSAGTEKNQNPGVSVEWTDEKQKQLEEAEVFLESLAEYKNGLYNAAVARQQGEAMAKGAGEIAKCLEIARRIAAGGRVPSGDERKLMEYSFEIYLAAKNAASLNSHKSNKKYRSLWEEKENNTEECRDIDSEINDRELSIEAPEAAEETI
ncbi:MAG: hypothetical protein QM697_09535 [Lachnospiraceae bacterium]